MHFILTRFRPDPRHFGLLAVAIATVMLLNQSSSALAQGGIDSLSDPSLSDEQRKEATLKWLDKYLQDSVLLRAADITKIREGVAQMSPTQLEQWVTQTRKLGEYIESPQWQDTKKWLKGFLRVQAMYSDAEIDKLRDDIHKASPDELLEILEKIQEKHKSLTWMYQASQQVRDSQVVNRNERVAQQAAAVQQSSAASRTGTSNVPLFGSGVAKGQKPSHGYSPPGPLINSNEVARMAVFRNVWGGGAW